ncbi:MAG: hypothetical protein ACREX9_09045 [Gammaproteobacteria bacterium]
MSWFGAHQGSAASSEHAGQRVKTKSAVLCLVLLSGCAAVGPDHKLAPTEVAGAFVNSGQKRFSSEPVDTLWWQGFTDQHLERLVDRAVTSNHDLHIASARLREAQALRGETAFDRYPTVTTEASYASARLQC